MAKLISPAMALFSLLSPVMAVGNYMQDRKRVQRERAEGLTEMAESVGTFRTSLVRLRATETRRRRAVFADPAETIRRATAPSTRLWERRPRHDDFMQLTVGSANQSWRPPIERAPGLGQSDELPPEAEQGLNDLGQLPFSPVAVDLAAARTLGVVGERLAALALLRSLVCQAAVHHGPADLRVAILTQPNRLTDWEWAKWLPHTHSLDEASGRRLLAATSADVDTVLAELLAPAPGTVEVPGLRSDEKPKGPVTLVVVDVDGLTEGRNAPARELLAGAGQATAGLILTQSVDRLPAVCTSVVELVGSDGLARFREPAADVEIPDVLLAGVPIEAAQRCARALAGFEDPEVADRGADLPDKASLLRILNLVEPTAEAILARWEAAGRVPRLAAPIGAAETGPLTLDLVTDGPHGLIAGTTGAGKSELLRTLVASLAANTGPEHLTFLLIDYKGGSAFAQCAGLPHTVGMVTDLDEHLGQRALRCLEAELHYREHRLREAGASDLKEYLQAGHPEPLPRLVVVIDEFATMVAELPDFIDSLVGVAQRGRSLGVHMILATQRPGGAVNNNIRANTNLRISLRVQDVAESVDVIGVPVAAAIGRYQAGRGYLRLGPGEVFPFQTALVTGATVETASTGITVRPYSFGPEPDRQATPRPETPMASAPAEDVPSDLEKLVAAAAEAARKAGYAEPRRPCPDPLPAHVVLDDLELPADAAPFAVPLGLVDDPDHQRQGVFMFNPAAGNFLCFGVSGAGTTTALATLAVSLARQHPVDRLHLYVLDFGTQALAGLAGLPHVGAVVGARDKERQVRMIRHLATELDRRRQWVAQSGAARVDPSDRTCPFPLTMLLLDNFAGFSAEYGDMGGDTIREQFTRLVADGPGLGVVVAATADRPGAVPSSIATLAPQKLVLRLGEMQDFTYFGIPTKEVPSLVPGRGLDAGNRLEVQLALPGPAGLAAAVAAAAAGSAAVDPTKRPKAIAVLPDEVKVAEIAGGVALSDSEWVLPVAIGDSALDAVALHMAAGDHALVAGAPRSGKSTVLDAIAAMVAKARPDVVITGVALRRSPLKDTPEVGRLVLTAMELDTAVEEILADTKPQLVLIDDCDAVDDPMNNLARLLSNPRPDLHIVAAGRADVLRSAYGTWTQTLRRSRLGLALKPDLDRDGDLFGVTLPRKGPSQFAAGRGYLVADGQVELIQAVQR
jgi:S-DNA-T family DNA segregation ATPase FtsK/SpoIIIE